jgi:uncharacterized damage-inducible protein DinB
MSSGPAASEESLEICDLRGLKMAYENASVAFLPFPWFDFSASCVFAIAPFVRHLLKIGVSWRPAPGVRSTSEVYMHIAITNSYLLQVTGPKAPADLDMKMEKTVTSKAEVIAWLKKSLEAVKTAHLAETPEDLKRAVKIHDRDATMDGIYLRIIVHANEHMGQLIAYARMTGIVPPWSKKPNE